MSLFILDKEDSNPKLGDTLHIRLRQLKDADGQPYNLLGASKIYATIKDSLSDPDVSADAQIDSVTNPGQFVLTYANSGDMDAIFSSTDTGSLVAGTLYYIDVRAIWNTGEVVSLVHDTIVFDKPVTLSTS
jgi:hypothetical protein